MNKENKTKFIRQSDFFLLLSFMEMKMIANNYRLKTKHKIIKEEKKDLDHFMVKTKKSTITNETKLCIVPCFKTHVVKFSILNLNDPHSKFQSFTQQSIVSSSRI